MFNCTKADLSITRIAGLTWNEWNARLAMPLVKQLSEGVQSLVFPTDLTINSADKQGAENSDAATQNTRTPTPPTIKIEKVVGGCGSGSGKTTSSSTTAILGNAATCKKLSSDNSNSSEELNEKSNKNNQLCEEEATSYMMKVEKIKSGNLSDTSFSEENNGVSAVAAAAQAAADFNLCNINILSSISAMNSLIGASGNGGLALNAGSAANLSGGANSGVGHPCPECGRVYKLKSSLRNHQKWECGKEPQFQCPFCVYRAKQKMHIGRHMERMHKEKFIKLEDLKSYTSSTSAGSGVGNAGGGGGGGSVSGTEDTASFTEMRQHYSN